MANHSRLPEFKTIVFAITLSCFFAIPFLTIEIIKPFVLPEYHWVINAIALGIIVLVLVYCLGCYNTICKAADDEIGNTPRPRKKAT